MKVIRNDATGFEAFQGRIFAMMAGVAFAIVGGAVATHGILNGKADHNKLAEILLGLGFFAIGALVVLFAKSTRIVTNPSDQTFHINFVSLVHHSEFIEPFADIQKVVEISTVQMEMNANQRGSSPTVNKTVQVLLRSGDAITIPLNTSNRTVNGIPLNLFSKKPPLGQLLATAIGVPFEPLGFGGAEVMNAASSFINQVASSGSFTRPQPAAPQAPVPIAPAPVAAPAPITPAPAAPIATTPSPIVTPVAAPEEEPVPPVDPTPPTPPASFGRSL